jgi:hypothetical protein
MYAYRIAFKKLVSRCFDTATLPQDWQDQVETQKFVSVLKNPNNPVETKDEMQRLKELDDYFQRNFSARDFKTGENLFTMFKK